MTPSLLSPTQRSLAELRQSAYQCIFDLTDDFGIAASSRQEVYGCLFGRDSAITILKLLRVYERTKDSKLLAICKKTLLTHVSLQGKKYVLESGEEPGKFIHEYRPNNYERLVNRPKPWYVYPDGILRNYDSVDATPLLLLAYHRYWQATDDKEFLNQTIEAVKQGIQWLLSDADKDEDSFIEYELPSSRTSGGLVVQSWTDSFASLTQVDGSFPIYPIAAVEVQAITWLCLQTWSDYFRAADSTSPLADRLAQKASILKIKFATHFLYSDHGYTYAAQALDGRKRPVTTVTANPLLCLWASRRTEAGNIESIVSAHTAEQLVRRAFRSDLFDPQAGMRTMSMESPLFDASAASYHNGSFWPMLNGLIHEGLELWGFRTEATRLKTASLLPLAHFKTPIELYCSIVPGEYSEYRSTTGKKGCLYQAWTAAAMLDWLTPDQPSITRHS